MPSVPSASSSRRAPLAAQALLPPPVAPASAVPEHVRIRPIRPSDLDLERRFVHGLSARTRYQRLLSSRDLLPGELERWTRVDPSREIALVAVVRGDDGDEEIGVARAVRDDDAHGTWDFAIVVADAWQRRGLGERLLVRLIDAVRAAGAEALGGITLSENRGMVALARKLGFRARRDEGDATITRLERRLDDATTPAR